MQTGGSLLTSLHLDSMQITVDLLCDLVNAIALFWLDMRIESNEALIPESPAMIKKYQGYEP